MFVVDLGKKMNSSCHKAWQGQMAWENKWFHQDWIQLGKVANVKLFKFGSGQRGFWGTLIKITFSPTCSIWSRCIITPFEHVHQVWEHSDMFNSAKLFKLEKGQKWLWEGFMGLYCSPWLETWQDHPKCHMWHARIFLDLLEDISCRNISNPWNGPKWFWEVLSNILTMTMCLNSYIWKIICPLSFPDFSQIFLKLSNNFNLLKTISGLKKRPLNKIGK